MCTFQDDRSALVCDVAIGHVREIIGRDLGPVATFTVRHGEGTLVELHGEGEVERFRAAIREGMQRAAVSG